MQQANESRYEVSEGEVVTVKLIAHKVADTAIFTTSPVQSEQIASSPRTYRFTAHGNPGDTIFGLITCDFTGAQDGASFHAVVSSPGSGPFDGPTINKDDPDSEEPISLDFEFPEDQ
ncbi:MAG: hypothetical protein QOC96_217 [Acidobacteriota bacterium]|jgi:hypothetical protein|nr:hypothetical protein [Acidobacteriota bacterium]